MTVAWRTLRVDKKSCMVHKYVRSIVRYCIGVVGTIWYNRYIPAGQNCYRHVEVTVFFHLKKIPPP
jgi:hypothetical protein